MESEESSLTISLGEMICFLEIDQKSALLLGGSANGKWAVKEIRCGLYMGASFRDSA